MKLLISKTEIKNLNWNDKIPMECEQCKKTFHKKKHHVLTILKSEPTKGKYCSTKCRGISKRKQTLGECKQCQTPITIKPYHSRNKHQFCSRSCKATYWNSHKTWGSTRSKLERWIEQQLTIQYPNLLIEYNKTSAINAELDIYIPSLKLAFELNGIFHYEPIFGADKLKSFQTNDARKFQACMENGIGLCIIDTHHCKYLKKERDQQFLKIITDIVDPLLKQL